MQFKNRKTRFDYYGNTKRIPTEVAQNTPVILFPDLSFELKFKQAILKIEWYLGSPFHLNSFNLAFL